MPRIEKEDYRRLLIGVFLAVGASLITLAVFFVESRQAQAPRAQEAVVDPQVLDSEDTLDDKTVELPIYFYRPSAEFSKDLPLITRQRTIPESGDPLVTIRRIVAEVLKGPGEDLPSIFPGNSRLLQAFLLDDGTAVVDLSPESAQRLPGGVVAEYAALVSIARSLTANVAAVKRVKFLVNGQDKATFGGHISLRDPFM